MKVIEDYTNNFDQMSIPVDFLIIHHTATSLEDALRIFHDPASSVSAHIVIAENGDVYEMVPCLKGDACRAWHAGISGYDLDGVFYENFNEFSIGIELVNHDGNIHPYPDQQITALIEVVQKLKELYPVLQDHRRIIGHEDIAGFRGKIDPGKLFPWDRLKA